MTLTTCPLEACCSSSSFTLKSLWPYFLPMLETEPKDLYLLYKRSTTERSHLPSFTPSFWAGIHSSAFETWRVYFCLWKLPHQPFFIQFQVSRVKESPALSLFILFPWGIQILPVKVSGRGFLFCFVSLSTLQAQRHCYILLLCWVLSQVRNLGLNIVSS